MMKWAVLLARFHRLRQASTVPASPLGIAFTGRLRTDAFCDASASQTASHCTPSQGTHIYPSDTIVQDSTLQWRDRSGFSGFPIKSDRHPFPTIFCFLIYIRARPGICQEDSPPFTVIPYHPNRFLVNDSNFTVGEIARSAL